METIKIQHLFGRFSIFFLVLIVVVFAEEYSIDRLCLNINVFPFIFMNAFMIVGIAYIYQKATRKLFIKELEYEIYEDFFYINGNKYEYQDVIKCEIHYFDYFFINVLCLHIDMKNTSKSTLLLYSEDLDEGNERNMLMPRVFPKRLGRVNSVTSLQVFKNCSINIVLSI